MANHTSFSTFSNITHWMHSTTNLTIVDVSTCCLLPVLASIILLLLINIPDLRQNKPRFKWILGLMKEMHTEIACIRLGNVHVIPYSSRGFLSVAVTPWGEQWKKMIRVVTSEIVSHARLKWLLQKRNEEADNLVFYLHNQCNKNSLRGGQVFNLRLLTRQFSGNVIIKMVLNKRYFGKGRKNGGPCSEEIEHVDSVFTVVSYIYSLGVQDYLPYLRWLDLDGHEKIVKRAMKVSGFDNGAMDNKLPEDLLDVLISLKDEHGKPLLSTEEIRAQPTIRLFIYMHKFILYLLIIISDIILATVDNPANVVEWAMAEMINQPDILRKDVEEIDKVVGKNRWVQESDFPKLNYVKACAREALRLHPIAPFNLPHVSKSDTVVSGYFIPKGSHVLLKLRFISFTTGRRGCIGGPLETTITVMLLARLIQGFDWSAPPGESMIDLSESANDLYLDKPLFAHAKPKLPLHIYPVE
ncbi:hypothetical protein MKW98_013844 [Papaver atlanticum]|uniref:Cytochrome P450 n=1 Tax=Papaver atlanticum TaxID=357466 RepID=A0AAD4XSN0_9MAGN|nr:hypothetical protein MKW98_013844 [Papaver atlanticum]